MKNFKGMLVRFLVVAIVVIAIASLVGDHSAVKLLIDPPS